MAFIIDNAGSEISLPHILHQMRENMKQVNLLQVSDGVGALVRFQGSPVAKLLCDYRADAGIAAVYCLGQRHGLGKYFRLEFLLTCVQRVAFVPGLGDKIGPAGQHLPDRAGLGGDVLDAVDDGLIFIAENNIAVFSHQFQNQILAPQISHIVIVLDLKVDNPLQPGLPDPQDLSVSHMLAQQHTEIGGGERPGLVGFCDIN